MAQCPECRSTEVYEFKKPIPAGGGYGPDFLPKLSGGPLSSAKVVPVLCASCGLIRLYATDDARSAVSQSKHWNRRL